MIKKFKKFYTEPKTKGGENTMKKIILSICLICCFICMGVVGADAATYTFSPSVADLQDLNHSYYYDWLIDWTIPGNERIVNAYFTYHSIYDSLIDPSDMLYTQLLDNPPAGGTFGTPSTVGTAIGSDAWRWYDAIDWHGTDFGSTRNNWDGQGPLIGAWIPTATTWPGITLTYDLRQLGLLDELIAFSSDGHFGFGIDGDCEYSNRGITLTVETAVPEPGTILLLGSGILGLALYARRRRS
jgi:hypothetical protein